ncbi:MAG TPA: pseudouridine synthase [Pyrinomonadaceae bacterium]|nr:pseudouridine synthase [Pyrinomonadaceae bacterium]
MNAQLPIIQGVGPSRQWLPPGGWKTVMEFFRERYPHVNAEVWARRMAKGQVIDERGRQVDTETPYRVGACIFYYRELENEGRIPFAEHVLYQDEHILVAYKPHFLPVIPAGKFLHETLLVRLRRKLGSEYLVPIHRLDRETAGTVLFSVNPKTTHYYTSLFQSRKIVRVYEALAPSPADTSFSKIRRSRIVRGEPFFRMKEVEGEANSETHSSLSRRGGTISLYELKPTTGKKHQLRLHLAALGTPIINDRLYPVMTSSSEDDFSRPLKLLAKSICFQDPVTNRPRYFESDESLCRSLNLY